MKTKNAKLRTLIAVALAALGLSVAGCNNKKSDDSAPAAAKPAPEADDKSKHEAAQDTDPPANTDSEEVAPAAAKPDHDLADDDPDLGDEADDTEPHKEDDGDDGDVGDDGVDGDVGE